MTTRAEINAMILSSWDVGREDALDGKPLSRDYMIPKEPTHEALLSRLAYIRGYGNGAKIRAILDEPEAVREGLF